MAPPRDCTPAEAGCQVGQEPDPAKPGACRPLLGTDLVCPKGFLPKAGTGDALPDCTADPVDCGDDPFGGVAEGAGAVFVSAAFDGTALGTRAAPYKSLAEAIETAPAGATVAIAAGTYAGGLVVGKPLKLLGRCAAMVHIKAQPTDSALVVKAGADGTSVQGIRMTGGHESLYVSLAQNVELHRVWVESALLAGVVLTAGASVNVSDSVVARTVGDKSDVDAGAGVVAIDAVVQMKRVRVTRSRGVGLELSGGAKVSVQDCVIDEGNPTQGNGPMGMGIFVGAATELTMQRSRLHRNGTAGIKAKGKGAKVYVERTAVTSTRPWWSAAKSHGIALHGQNGAHITADAVWLHDNRTAGAVGELDGDGVLKIRRSAITGTRPLSAVSWGPGVSSAGKVQVELTRVLLHNNEYHSALFDHGAHAVLRDVVVSGNRLGGDSNDYSAAIAVFHGSQLAMEDVALWQNADCGILAADALVNVVGRRVLIAHTANRGVGDVMVAPAVYAQDGATVWLHDSRIYGSEGVAVLPQGSNTAVRLTRVTLDHSLPLRSNGDYGLAVVAAKGAKVELLGVRATDNHGASVVADLPATRIVANGLLVDHTLPRKSDGGGGHAIYGAHGAALELVGTWVVDNYATGIAVDKSALLADRTVVRMTRFANLIDPDRRQMKVALGDALLGASASAFEIRRSIAVDNQRAGLLVDGTPGAILTGTLVARGTFGVVTQSASTLISKGNLVYGNSQQNRSGESGLAVPVPPSLVGK